MLLNEVLASIRGSDEGETPAILFWFFCESLNSFIIFVVEVFEYNIERGVIGWEAE